MSTVIGIMGQSGHGKTTAMRTLDTASTYYVDADRKGLSWRGWTKQYRDGRNYARTSDPQAITALLRRIDSGMPNIRQVVIDTANGIMLDAEMGRIHEHGYGKWTELAADVYDLISVAGQLRSDLIVIVGFHVQIAADQEGVDHILTNGRKLEKVHIETKLPILLYAKCMSSEAGNQYVLETQARGSTAKTPMGMFDALEVPNDMQAVVDAVRAYQEGDEYTPQHDPERLAPETAVKDASTPDAGNKDRPPRREIPAGSDVDRLIELMARDNVSPVMLSRYCADLKRGWLRDGDLEMAHIPPERLSKMVTPEIWPKVAEACRKASAKPDPFDAVNAVRTLMELTGITDDDLDAYCHAKAGVIKGLAEVGQCWWESDADVLAKLAEDAVWEKAAKWMKANKEGK
jgi:hypothetical protein